MRIRFIAVVVTVIWIFLISIPIGSNPPLYTLFLYPTSPIKIDNSYSFGGEFDRTRFGTATVKVDERGVPHVFAENQESAAYATGFIQARDRLFQMEMLQRTVRGRLCEVVGKVALPRDRFWRKFRFESRATEWEKWVKDNDPTVYGILEAYSEGVNAYINQLEKEDRPIEYQLIGFEPSPFQVSNIYYLEIYMNWVLSYSEHDLAYEELMTSMDEELFNFYYPWIDTNAVPVYDSLAVPFPYPNAIPANKTIEIDKVAAHFPSAFLPDQGEMGIGSNNWAVAAEKSKTGNAILSNDPHLTIQLPSTFYEMHYVIDGQRAHGLSIAGAPMLVIGFNEYISWGSTNSTWDLVDFYELEFNESGQYLLDGKWTDLITHKEIILSKDAGDVLIDVHESYFGILDTVDGRVLAISWIPTEVQSNEASAFIGLFNSTSLEEAYEELKKFRQPPQNIILADTKGDIGLATSGCAYIRKEAQRGIIQGRSKEDKATIVPMNEYTHVLRPGKNWIASANQNHFADSLNAHLATRFAASNRAKRIQAWMSENEKLGVEDFMKMHQDVIDTDWELLQSKFTVALPKEYLNYFEGYNGSINTNSIAATIFTDWKKQFINLIKRELGNQSLPPTSQHLFHLLANHDSLPSPGGPIASHELIVRGLNSSLDSLIQTLGSNPEDWKYGNYHTTWIRHIAKIDALSADAFPSNGNNRTLNVAHRNPTNFGPSMRIIVNMDPDEIEAYIVLAGGQSGRFDSPNYTDQVNLWKNGGYTKLELPYTEDEIYSYIVYKFGL